MTMVQLARSVFARACFSLCALMVVSVSSTGAQNKYVVPQDDALKANKEGQGNAAIISLTVKDSSLKYVVNEIARQAGLRAIYDNSSPLVAKKVSVAIKGLKTSDAFAKALTGTGLLAKFAPDGETVIIALPENSVRRTLQSDNSISGIIAGRVTDSATERPIAGVTISVEGTKLIAVTDAKGVYQIGNVAPGKHAISFKLLGYRSIILHIEVKADGRSNLDARLSQAATSLNEVVTTAVGTQRRVEIGNDIVKLNATEILERAPARSVSDLLRFAQVPGVSVQTAGGEPGAPTRIRMRGIGSISQNTDPAVIVDGIWINSRMSDSSVVNKAWGRGATNSRQAYTSSPLDNIDPNTIETIEIVKGPSAASLYGQEAANGVIVITTKKGKAGPTSWSYSFSRDWDSQVRQKYGNWYGYGTSASGSPYPVSCHAASHYELLCIQDSVMDMNRFGNLFDDTGPGSLNNHSFAVRGGVSTINYSFSGSYKNSIGTRRIPRIDLIRSRIFDVPLSKDITTPGSSRDIYVNSSIGFKASKDLFIDLVFGANNSTITQSDVEFNGGTNQIDTIIFSTSMGVMTGGSDALSINSALSARFQPDSWWNAQGSLGVDLGERRDHGRNDYRQCRLGKCEPAPVLLSSDRLRQNSVSNKVLTARLSASGGIHTPFDRFLSVTPSVGLDVRRGINKGVLVRFADVPFGADQANGDGKASMDANDVITAGYYVNGSFKLLNRMYFDIGFRQDAGSVIKMNSSSRYPKFATSWLVSDEGFFPKSNMLSGLKLRGAIGYAAVHPDEADLYGGYIYSRAQIDGQITWVAELQGVGNNKLVPERSLEVEGGFDAYLWGDRAELMFTVANKTLHNAIIDRRIPTSSGLSSSRRKENISRVQNRSIEIGITTRIIDNDFMLLQLGTNISNVNNVIRRLGNNTLTASNTSKDRLVEGYQIGAVWDRPVLGYSDVNGDGFLEASEIMLGDTTVYKGWNTPKFTAAYNGSISVLNQNLTASFSLAQTGPRVQYATFLDNYGETVVGAPIESQVLYMAAISNIHNRGTAMSVSELRLNSASISYNLPRNFTSRFNAKLITVSLQGSNLGLWTNYSGRDPMVNSTPVGNLLSDNGFTLPMPRKYAFNVRLEL